MKILMISGDKRICDEKSEAHARMQAYASVCDELHIVILTDQYHSSCSYGNLFFYCAFSPRKIMQRIEAYRVGKKVAADRKIDYITAQSPDDLGIIAWRISRLGGIALQLQVHTDILSPWYRYAGALPWIKYRMARFLLPRAQCIRVVSKRIKQSLIRELHIADSRITVLPIFTDVQEFGAHKSVGMQDTHVSDSSCKIISVGRFLDREKNFSMLIKAMAHVIEKCPSAILVLIGEGPDKERYEDLINIYGLKNRVIIEPWRTDMAAVYASFDLFVLPSYIEGWGRAVIEAMASGCAIVMTDVGLANDVVHNGVNGLVVPVGDFGALATALIELCEQPEKRKKFARVGRESVMRLYPQTQEEYLAAWKKSFEHCISGNL
ncbi:MAG: glycosyltransferase family 4 protein [Candidatus Sungbacteria bacterium]|nr:glycosyltransferase family 4 protein [bacterium]MDZ4260202.1 glycosyltransferase family 4 protein [Candidatus Sungbacteria bacterium]